MKTMKIDFSKIKLKNIDGESIPEALFYKTIANLIYIGAKTLDLVETAREINKGKAVELSKTELVEIINLIKDPKSGVFAHAQKSFIDFVEKEKIKDKVKKK